MTTTIVLTAAHVVQDASTVRVRFETDQPGEWLAEVIDMLAVPEIDVALLTIVPLDTAEVVPARFGLIAERDELIDCSAVGFPRWKLRDDPAGPYRDSAHIVGSASALANRREGTLEITVPPPERDPDPAVSPWQGMSGAAVFSNGRIVGILSRHYRSDGLGRLTASRAGRWRTQVSPARLHDMESLLGISLESLRPGWTGGCPYRGLLPYDPAHAAVFYGRELMTAELAEMLARTGIVVVTGPSGAGKTSVLQAGLVPVLDRGEPLPGSSSWPRIAMTPTAHPLAELAAQLGALGGKDSAAIRDSLAAAPADAHLVIREILLAAARRGEVTGVDDLERLVLIIDQFEQVFDLAGEGGERERAAFIEAVCAAATQPAGPRSEPSALAVIAVRGDYWDRCAAYPLLVSAMQRGQFIVGPMDEADLRRAITGPADESGLRVETSLTDAVLSELRREGVNIQVPGLGVAASNRGLRSSVGRDVAVVGGRGFRDDCGL